jgi:signal transduction histidine kinase
MLSEALELDRHTEIVVHDLQTRLQPILAHAEKLRKGLGQAVAQHSSIETLVTTAEDLFQSVLALRVPIWNLGNFMPHYQFEYHSLAGLVEEAVTLYKAEAERKEVGIRIELKGASRIQMSRTHLQHAISNLLHNAIKYSFYGHDDLDRFVGIRGTTDGLDYVLTFSNYGVGILPEEFELIFEPGYQGKRTYAEYRTGSGMGLTITKEVIEKHHGTIGVESRKMGGEAYQNRFIIRLPFAQPIGSKEEQW